MESSLTQLNSGRIVALKSFENGALIAKFPDVVVLFNQIINEISSPYLIKYHTFFKRDDDINIVMEYCKEGNLEDLLSLKKTHGTLFSNPTQEQMIAQLLVGLYVLHQKKVLHGNIKTRNILISNGDLKLTDFGMNELSKKSKIIPITYKSDICSLGLVFEKVVSVNGLTNFQEDKSISSDIRSVIMLMQSPDECKFMSDLISNSFVKRVIATLPCQKLPSGLLEACT